MGSGKTGSLKKEEISMCMEEMPLEKIEEGVNMVGMTNEDVIKEADRNAAGCLVASLFGAALLACVLGWLVYLACARWPALVRVLPTLGFAALGWAAHMVWSGSGFSRGGAEARSKRAVSVGNGQ